MNNFKKLIFSYKINSQLKIFININNQSLKISEGNGPYQRGHIGGYLIGPKWISINF
jgi:hypothetical protein